MWMTPGTVPSSNGTARTRCAGRSETAHKTATAATRAAVTIEARFMEPKLEPGRLLQRRRLVGPLPGEVGLAPAEVAECRRLRVDRTAQVQFVDDAARRELEVAAHD